MKKFLCYDTNDAASGKINVDNRGMLKPNSTVPSGSTPYQQLVTDGTGTAKWEDRLAYVESRVVVETNNGFQFVKVSNDTKDWLSDGLAVNVFVSDGNTFSTTINRDGDIYFAREFCIFSNIENAYSSIFDVTLPEKGVYFMNIPGGLHVTGVSRNTSESVDIAWDGKLENVKQIDEKILPEVTKLVMLSSTSGSAKKFEITVDDTGTLSATEITSGDVPK